MMGSTTIVEALRKADDDKQVAAIVLRIDSPGGSALASDLIWRETQVIKKPIVASMGDVAGSGGYYIAMGADKIIAAPGTITGSIGVVGGKLADPRAVREARHHDRDDQRGRNSGLFALERPVHRLASARSCRDMMEDIYGQFTTKAAEGRKMPRRKAARAGRRPRLHRPAGAGQRAGRRARHAGRRHSARPSNSPASTRTPRSRSSVLPEPTNFFESLFGELDAEEEVRLGPALAPLAPELVEVGREGLPTPSGVRPAGGARDAV